MFSESLCVAIQGIEGYIVQIEADISDGLPCFSMVGYLDSKVKEAKERVRVALKNSGFRLPPKRITINLSPADIRKDGTGYDLAIALAILAAFGYVPADILKQMVCIGELSLDGQIKRVNGVLPMVYTARQQGLKYAMVPSDNYQEASLVSGICVLPVNALDEIVNALSSGRVNQVEFIIPVKSPEIPTANELDFIDVCGQEMVKRAVTVAVAGRHNLLMIGPPGSGKTMIAKRIPGVMVPLEFDEKMELSKIYSVAGLLDEKLPFIQERPFRSPHHTITSQALVGGGRYPLPGECSLSSNGVLFLDELPEFSRQTIEVLRQPLEDGYVTISRIEGSYRYPARFQLVAAANPCRCGYYPDRKKCTCSEQEIRSYFGKISKPILDRIDICTETLPLDLAELSIASIPKKEGMTSDSMRQMISKTVKIQRNRYQSEDFSFNSQLTPRKIKKYCMLETDVEDYLKEVFAKLQFSARGYHKILRIARTIADMEEKDVIEVKHVAEAICYRSLDQKYSVFDATKGGAQWNR